MKDTVQGEGWVVVLHNDSHNMFDHVIASLCNAINIGVDEASDLARTAHENGKVFVTITTKNTASRITSNLKKCGLRCDTYLIGTN